MRRAKQSEPAGARAVKLRAILPVFQTLMRQLLRLLPGARKPRTCLRDSEIGPDQVMDGTLDSDATSDTRQRLARELIPEIW